MIALDQAGLGRKETRILRPSASIASAVEFGWTDTMRASISEHAPWRIVADASAHLIYQRFEEPSGRRDRLVVVGARSVFKDIDRSGRVLTAGLRLRPGTLSTLLHVDAAALTDTAVPIDLLLHGKHAADLRSRIEDADETAVVDELARFVLLLLQQGTGTSSDVRHLDDAVSMGKSPAVICAQTGWSPRKLRSVCRQHVGLAPMRWIRIARLQRALINTIVGGETSLARAGMIAGYFDQSHFTRDCTDILGEPPAAFIQRGRR